MALPPPTRIPSTWRTRYPAAGHPSVSGQRDLELCPPERGMASSPRAGGKLGQPALRLCQCLALPPGSFSPTQGTGQGACETVTPIMSVGPTQKWSPSHQPSPERSRWAVARACVWSRGSLWPGRSVVRQARGRGAVLAAAAAPTFHDVPAFSPPTGHLTLPEGSDKEKDRALRHGQLGSAEPGRVLPPALRGAGALPRDFWLCPQPSWPSWLLLTVRPRAGPRPRCTKAGWAYGSIYCLPRPLPSQVWDQSPSQAPGK